MIIPTPKFDPLFAEDGVPFRTKMVQYIEREFADIVGDQKRLLQTEGGLEIMSKIVSNRLQDDWSRTAA